MLHQGVAYAAQLLEILAISFDLLQGLCPNSLRRDLQTTTGLKPQLLQMQ